MLFTGTLAFVGLILLANWVNDSKRYAGDHHLVSETERQKKPPGDKRDKQNEMPPTTTEQGVTPMQELSTVRDEIVHIEPTSFNLNEVGIGFYSVYMSVIESRQKSIPTRDIFSK